MKTTEQKVPALRFSEFEGEWEVKKLSQVCTIKTGGKDTKDRIDDGKYPFYVRSDKVEAIDSYVLDTEAILTSGDGVGVGRNFHYINGKFNYHQRVYALYNFHLKYNGKFIYYYFSENFFQRVMRLSAKNSVDSVRMDMISKMPISFPSLLEQQKIADFLSATDKRLELLKEKKQGLEDYKRGAMQRIFSQELRFTRADGSAYEDWEEKKLGEVCEVMRGTSFSKSEMVEEGEMKCIHYGELFTEYKEVISFISSRTNITKGVFSHKGDVLMPTSDVTPNGLARASALSIENVLLGGDMNIIRIQKRLLSVFLSYFLNFDKQNIIRLVTGTTVKHIYASDIKSLDIPLPSLSEQAQIANFLSAIDVKIEKLNEQIEATENYKKGLLQQMFV